MWAIQRMNLILAAFNKTLLLANKLYDFAINMLIGLRVELTSNPLNQQQDGPISSELDSLPAAPSSSLQAWRKLYYEPATAVQRYQSLFDDTKPQPGSPLERIQFEILSRLQQQQQNT